MGLRSTWNTTKTSALAAIASAGLITTTAPEAEAASITVTGAATISSSDAALLGTDFVVGETVNFSLDIDMDVTDELPTMTNLGIYEDAISGQVNVGSTYEGIGSPSALTIIDNATSPSADIIGFSLGGNSLSSNILPNGNDLSGILFNFLADTGQYSGDDITNISQLPDFDTGTLRFIFNGDTANQLEVTANVDFGTVSVVPEPGSAAIGLVGLGALAMRRRRPENTLG